MANRGDSNRCETPRRIRRMLALTEFKDNHQRGQVMRLFQAATAHAQSVDRYILPGHGYQDPAAIAAEMEVAQAITAAAEAAVDVAATEKYDAVMDATRSKKSEETPAP